MKRLMRWPPIAVAACEPALLARCISGIVANPALQNLLGGIRELLERRLTLGTAGHEQQHLLQSPPLRHAALLVREGLRRRHPLTFEIDVVHDRVERGGGPGDTLELALNALLLLDAADARQDLRQSLLGAKNQELRLLAERAPQECSQLDHLRRVGSPFEIEPAVP